MEFLGCPMPNECPMTKSQSSDVTVYICLLSSATDHQLIASAADFIMWGRQLIAFAAAFLGVLSAFGGLN